MAPIDLKDVRVRLPAQLRKLVKLAAAESGRSMNAEILARLERSFGDGDEDRRRAVRLLTEALTIVDKGGGSR
ncbi:Arc family DNA-binding protein [Mesorhizobium sp. ES1-4]|uniref:Arc family DNA-binding protein n=1 Tax=Mesorhizobium sp. ES1-4 TaxID=2876627 RepID=UPI001CCC7139|nr:Arc family DNA-binding protein [Mesorhizobium sp. ES1-4]MBZ9794332.1 Arc family DNA-binding protein [Mesorhizobium sp. ES1-4]